ncbi:MAG: alpha/beta hydrolase, partial [Candidatus Hydrogenedentes bacterium]|nr:alpha/beta hydrolase [Candidatus Hydrogenedentota bacterium]
MATASGCGGSGPARAQVETTSKSAAPAPKPFQGPDEKPAPTPPPAGPAAIPAGDIFDQVKDGYADNNGVKIHYATLGEGPVVVMIHGFPDFWYSWRHQMAALAPQFKCVAMDLRGYNLSDKPKGDENYTVPRLFGDVAAVIKAQGVEKATVVGHDWGGAIAWQFAMAMPEMVERLVICNLPHPKGLMRELATNPEQQKNSQYARDFQQPGAEQALTAEGLAAFVAKGDAQVAARYVDAFTKSDFSAMLAYYRMNYPREPYQPDTLPLVKINVPVLMFHGLKDTALGYKALNDTWEWLGSDLTLVTIPEASHWVHHDAHDLVSKTMQFWLARDAGATAVAVAPAEAGENPFQPGERGNRRERDRDRK